MIDYRVLHVIGATVAGGAEIVAVNLARELTALGISSGVFALSGNIDGVGTRLRSALDGSGVFFACGPKGPVGIGALIRYRKALNTFRPRVVHLHTPNTELAHAIAAPRERFAVARTIHNTHFSKNRAYEWGRRRNKVSVSVACSSAVAATNRDWAGECLVIQNGVDFSWPKQTPAVKRDACLRLGLTLDSRHYVMIGSMRGKTLRDAQKAHDVAIDAWRHSSLGHRGHHLHFIGDGPLRQELTQHANNSEGIVFHGVSADIATWLCAADCFLMPSRSEGLPLAGIEALGTGLPCIFSDIPPLRELRPSNALWCKVDNVGSVVSALEESARKPDLYYEKEPDEVRRKFGMPAMAAAYVEYYEKIASTDRRTT